MFEFINESVVEGSRQPTPDKAGRQTIRKQVMRDYRSRQRDESKAQAGVLRDDLKTVSTSTVASAIKTKEDFIRYIQEASATSLSNQMPHGLGRIPIYIPNGQDLGEIGYWYWVNRRNTGYGVSVDINDALLRSGWDKALLGDSLALEQGTIHAMLSRLELTGLPPPPAIYKSKINIMRYIQDAISNAPRSGIDPKILVAMSVLGWFETREGNAGAAYSHHRAAYQLVAATPRRQNQYRNYKSLQEESSWAIASCGVVRLAQVFRQRPIAVQSLSGCLPTFLDLRCLSAQDHATMKHRAFHNGTHSPTAPGLNVADVIELLEPMHGIDLIARKRDKTPFRGDQNALLWKLEWQITTMHARFRETASETYEVLELVVLAVELHTWIASRVATVADILARLGAILQYAAAQEGDMPGASGLVAMWFASGGKPASLFWVLSCFVGYAMKTTCVDPGLLTRVSSALHSLCLQMGVQSGQDYAEVLTAWPKNPCSFFAKPIEIWAAVGKLSASSAFSASSTRD